MHETPFAFDLQFVYVCAGYAYFILLTVQKPFPHTFFDVLEFYPVLTLHLFLHSPFPNIYKKYQECKTMQIACQ